MSRQLSRASTLDNLKKEAKRWLKHLRAGEAQARARLDRALPEAGPDPTLRNVQHALALEHGASGWSALAAQVAAIVRARTVDLIPPDELRSAQRYGPGGSRACDVWDAICAARSGDLKAIRHLLSRDPDLARYGEVLHFAAREGHLAAVRLLVGAGADADASGPDGESLATVARDRGHDAVARFLDSARGRGARTAPAETPDEHAIHRAADANDLGALRALLDADPDLVRLGDRKAASPLHRAVAASAHDAIALLLDRGADIHARHGSGPGDAAGYAPVDHQPIDIALFWHDRNDVATTRLLVARGAVYDLAIAAALGDTDAVVAMLDADARRIHEARPFGRRPLSAAVLFGHDAIAHLLLARGADPNWPEGSDAPGGLALHAAARAGNASMVEALLDHGANPNASVDSSGSATWAAKTKHLRALLLSRGGVLDCYDLVWLGEDDEVVRRVTADPRAADAGCGGVFTAAATLGKRELVVRLLAAGARVPPVLTACRSYLLENAEILRLLLAGGMDPDLPNWQRATPLHELCGRDGRGRARPLRQEAAKILLDAGASLVARDEEYRSTPLAWAARTNQPDMITLLLDRGAPTHLPEDEPWATPLAWAVKRGHRPIEDMLRAAGATR